MGLVKPNWRSGSVTPNFQSPDFSRGLGQLRFASRSDCFIIAFEETYVGPPNDAGRTDCCALARRRLPDQANPSCFSWSAQTVGRLRTSLVTVRSAGARPSAIASMMRGER